MTTLYVILGILTFWWLCAYLAARFDDSPRGYRIGEEGMAEYIMAILFAPIILLIIISWHLHWYLPIFRYLSPLYWGLRRQDKIKEAGTVYYSPKN